MEILRDSNRQIGMFHDVVYNLTEQTIYVNSMPSDNINLTYNADPNGIKIPIKHLKDTSVPYLPETYVLCHTYVPSNAGHVLGDEVFAVYQSLAAFDKTDELENVKIITNNRGNHLQQFSAMIDINNLCSYEDMISKYGNVVKFKCLIAGMAGCGYALAHQQNASGIRDLSYRASYLPNFMELFQNFQQHCLKINNISPSKKKNITFLGKNIYGSQCKCMILNMSQLVSAVKLKYPDYHVNQVIWDGMNIRDQMQVMCDTDIVISLAGASLINCAFLPFTSKIICPFRQGPRGIETSNEIDIWFKHTHRCCEFGSKSKYFQVEAKGCHGIGVFVDTDELLEKMNLI